MSVFGLSNDAWKIKDIYYTDAMPTSFKKGRIINQVCLKTAVTFPQGH